MNISLNAIPRFILPIFFILTVVAMMLIAVSCTAKNMQNTAEGNRLLRICERGLPGCFQYRFAAYDQGAGKVWNIREIQRASTR